MSSDCHFQETNDAKGRKRVENMTSRREGGVIPDSSPSNGTILVIEDDPRMQKVLKRLFAAEGYVVEGVADGKMGVDAFHALAPAAVVLDLMLPGVPGRDVCKRIKGASPNTPVIVVSAVTEVADKVLLLELGADDYVTKPFSPRELLARVQAALRRTRKTGHAATVAFGICEVDYLRMSVRKSGQYVALTAHEFKLLKFFLENPERVLGREELLNDVWGYNFYPTTRTVDNQILKLRQKLEVDPGNPLHFVTVHGAGYKFVP
jgi:DNA-binding response OmpR family regulator